MLPVFLFIAMAYTTSFTQFPPTPTGVTTKHSSQFPGASISYKQTNLCPGSASWAGYVHIPSDTAGNEYDASLFYWYFEAQNDPDNAPTTIYLAGGPGESSMYGVLSDGGPCTVHNDSNSTQENLWSMNGHSNMLYIDQPVGAGFSYNEILKSTLSLLELSPLHQFLPFEAWNGSVPPQNSTFYYGLLPSTNPLKTANNSLSAARLLWTFSQVWFSEFPWRSTQNERINLWGNSYGGFWTLISGQYFQRQNQRISAGDLLNCLVLPLDTVGFTNGIIDVLRQFEYYPEYLVNNTYGKQVIPMDIYESAKHNITKPGGCNDQIKFCRQLGDAYDPKYTMSNTTLNKICEDATLFCAQNSDFLPFYSNTSLDDIAHIAPDPFPSDNIGGFLNREWVQQELGVPLNFTGDSLLVENLFIESGDFARTVGFDALEYLLGTGVKVALVYGDRDPDVPWTTAEPISLEVKWSGADEFRKAGYEYVQVNETYKGALTRQHGNFSFTRVFQSGHDVSAYQPETNYRIFNRVLFNKDIATGKQDTGGSFNNYSSHGPSNSWFHKEVLPPSPAWLCYTYYIDTCTLDQYWALQSGTAEVEEWYVVKPIGKIPGAIAKPP